MQLFSILLLIEGNTFNAFDLVHQLWQLLVTEMVNICMSDFSLICGLFVYFKAHIWKL